MILPSTASKQRRWGMVDVLFDVVVGGIAFVMMMKTLFE